MTVFNDFDVASSCSWFASGGTFHFGGSNGFNSLLENNSASFYLHNVVVDEDVSGVLSGASLHKVNINGTFTIKPGAEFTLSSSAEIEVGNTLAMEADATKASSFIDDGTLTTTGNLDIQKYISADRWHYFSSPVTLETASTFLEMYLYSFNESTYDPGPPAVGGWENIINETTPLNVGVGYKVWSFSPSPGSTVTSFTNGTLNNGPLSLPISATDQNGGGIGDGEGWNLAGNPYPSALDWTDASWTKTNLTGSVYVYDGIQYLAWPAEGGYGTLPGGIIPSGQAFFVKANDLSPALGVTNDARVHGVDAYKATTELNDVLELTVYGNDYQDKTFVSFNEHATANFDDQYDAYKLMGIDEAPQLYSMGDVLYTVNAQPELQGDVSISLGFNVGVEGLYKIVPTEVESFDPETEIYLEDIQEGVLVDLNVQKKYSFFATPEDNTERFILHFFGPTVGIENDLVANDNGFVIYSSNQSVFVKNTEETSCTVKVYDIMGHEVANVSNTMDMDIELKVNSSQGFYIVKVLTSSGVTSKKVYIK